MNLILILSILGFAVLIFVILKAWKEDKKNSVPPEDERATRPRPEHIDP